MIHIIVADDALGRVVASNKVIEDLAGGLTVISDGSLTPDSHRLLLLVMRGR